MSGAADKKYYTGDRVYIKRRKDDRWSGPGVVLGQDHQQILVRIGGFMYRVHPCRIILAEESGQATGKSSEEQRATEKDDKNSNITNPTSEDEIEADEEKEEINEEQHVREITQEFEDQQVNDAPEEIPVIERGRVHDGEQQRGEGRRQRFPTSGIKIRYRKENDEWQKAEVLGRVHLYKDNHLYNIRLSDNDEIQQLDFKNEVKEWQHLQDNEATEEIYICATREREEINRAKEAELENWTKNGVYEEIEDLGQEKVSVKWVIKEKIKGEERKYKARLVARGYEEWGETRSDSPTCSKESIRIILTIAAAKHWQCNALDIKAAFLQGREVFLKPPAEAKSNGKIWTLRRCVYSVSDASRKCFLKVKEEMTKLGAITIKQETLRSSVGKDKMTFVGCYHLMLTTFYTPAQRNLKKM